MTDSTVRPAAHGGPADAGRDAGVAGAGDPAMTARLRLAIARIYRQMVQASSGQGLTFAQLSALARIEQHGPLRLGELAARERVAASSMTRTLAPLTAGGLVVRDADPHDRRSCLVDVTGHGREVVEQVRRERSEMLAARIAGLSAAQYDALAAAIPVLEVLAGDPRTDDPRSPVPDAAAGAAAGDAPTG